MAETVRRNPTAAEVRQFAETFAGALLDFLKTRRPQALGYRDGLFSHGAMHPEQAPDDVAYFVAAGWRSTVPNLARVITNSKNPKFDKNALIDAVVAALLAGERARELTAYLIDVDAHPENHF